MPQRKKSKFISSASSASAPSSPLTKGQLTDLALTKLERQMVSVFEILHMPNESGSDGTSFVRYRTKPSPTPALALREFLGRAGSSLK